MGNKERVDHDLALLRLSYPVADPDTGLTLLAGATFSKDSVMPICMPFHKGMKDSKMTAFAVGVGRIAEKYNLQILKTRLYLID